MTKLYTYDIVYTVKATIAFNPEDFDIDTDLENNVAQIDLEKKIKEGMEYDGIQPYVNDEAEVKSSEVTLTFVKVEDANPEEEQ